MTEMVTCNTNTGTFSPNPVLDKVPHRLWPQILTAWGPQKLGGTTLKQQKIDTGDRETLGQADPLLQPAPWKVPSQPPMIYLHLNILLDKLVFPNEIHSQPFLQDACIIKISSRWKFEDWPSPSFTLTGQRFLRTKFYNSYF